MDINGKYLRISIVTPCFNSENTIEETLKSIHDQDYPNLQHIVMDGGSTDSTLDIIKKYEEKIFKIVSKKDKGQYSAIQEGFTFSDGDVCCWLNADDIMMPWTLHSVNELFLKFSDMKWLIGKSAFINSQGLLKKIYSDVSAKSTKGIQNGWYCKDGYGYLMQESMFWTKDLWGTVGGLSCEYSLAADYDLWIKFSKFSELTSVDIPLAAFRKHENSRSVVQSDKYEVEVKKIRHRLKKLPMLFRILGRNKYLNFLLRVLIQKRTSIITQPMNSNNWILRKARRPLSGIGINSLFLELKK